MVITVKISSLAYLYRENGSSKLLLIFGRLVHHTTSHIGRLQKLRGLYSASELYRLMTATCPRNLVPTFVDRRVSRGQRGRSPTVVNLSFLDRSRYFSFK
jgi:hypothetical protein